jgi:hypothetical protein
VPGGGGDSVSADTSAAGPQHGRTPLKFAVDGCNTSAAQLMRRLGATK